MKLKLNKHKEKIILVQNICYQNYLDSNDKQWLEKKKYLENNKLMFIF